MFKGFDLSITKEFFSESYEQLVEIGRNHLNEQKNKYDSKLEKFIIESQKLDGVQIQDEWFPQVDADIFISHSRQDKELACALAGWMNYEFGLKCFVDSNVWGYANNLIRKMNRRLSNERSDGQGGFLYDYDSCNEVSQHVNTMLSIALQKMINKTETVMLLNTDSSIPIHNEKKMNETYSPWIYTELVCTQIVQLKPLIAYRNYSELSHMDERKKVIFEGSWDINKSIISYKVSLEHLIRLNQVDLQTWKENYDERKLQNADYWFDINYPLDVLYGVKCPQDLMEARKSWGRMEYK